MSAPLAPTRASGETSCIIFYQLCNIVKLRQILTATMQNVTVPFLDITVNHDACLYIIKPIHGEEVAAIVFYFHGTPLLARNAQWLAHLLCTNALNVV